MERRKDVNRKTANTKKVNAGFYILLIIIILINISCSKKFSREDFPELVLPSRPVFEDMYWKTWESLYECIEHGNGENNFPRDYLLTNPDNILEQWGTIFMAHYGIYSQKTLPVMNTIDIFYENQRSDGYISRAFLKSSGKALNPTTSRYPMINPPLFSWLELKYYRLTNDIGRLERIFPKLEKYFLWLDSNCRGKDVARNLYFITKLGSHMENAPRGNLNLGGWIDMSSQMALFALDLHQIADILNNTKKASFFKNKYKLISQRIQKKLWNNDFGFFYDISLEGEQSRVKTIASFWPLLAKIPNEQQAEKLIQHLSDTTEFFRPHLFPSVAADEECYDPEGFYWRGGVWSSTNYMVLKGLCQYEKYNFSNLAAWNHLENVADVFANPDLINKNKVADNNDNYNNSIWELYSAENNEPGTRWDDEYYGMPNAVEYSGLASVAMVIEDIIGFDIDIPGKKICWRITMDNSHGMKNLQFGNNKFSLWCEDRKDGKLPFIVHGQTDFSVTIEFQLPTEHFEINFSPGPIEFSYMPIDYIYKERSFN